ncbi:MAG: hypothetical protein D3910_09835, partial [Candidatus Electrothrix sp. ATG2]|nr:hypothetical protein [Candidatus Electrothrix sp. ATG2]
ACHFKSLRKKGMSIKTLKRFFFAERYGAEVVIPSMRPIAAWLALWNEDVRRELIRRKPEVLLAYGDPGTLSIEDRAKLLRAFAAAYGEGGWRGISISIGEIRRMAHPELAPVIRELWEKYFSSEEVSRLLLRLIWQGAIKGCADIAEEVVWDIQRSEYQRKLGVFCLVVCKQTTTLLDITKSILDEHDKWPEKIIPELTQELFPKHLSVTELIKLIKRVTTRREVSALSLYFQVIAKELDPLSCTAIDLRKEIASLIWQGRHDKQEGYWRIEGKYSYLSSGLAILCEKQLAGALANDDLIWACAVANRFGTKRNESNDPQFHALKEHFKDNLALREKAFWIEADLMGCLVPAKEDRLIEHAVMDNSLIGHRTEAQLLLDQAWLFKALKDTTVTRYRHIALESLLILWHLNERSEKDEKELVQAVADDTSLSEQVKKATAPVKPNPKKEKWERRERRRECVRKGRERQRVEKWQQWRKKILAHPDDAFCPEQEKTTLYYIYRWLE